MCKVHTRRNKAIIRHRAPRLTARITLAGSAAMLQTPLDRPIWIVEPPYS